MGALHIEIFLLHIQGTPLNVFPYQADSPDSSHAQTLHLSHRLSVKLCLVTLQEAASADEHTKADTLQTVR